MNNFGGKVAFIWSVADRLRDAFMRSKYPDVILPLTVLRRLDCVLEPSKERVLTAHGPYPQCRCLPWADAGFIGIRRARIDTALISWVGEVLRSRQGCPMEAYSNGGGATSSSQAAAHSGPLQSVNNEFSFVSILGTANRSDRYGNSTLPLASIVPFTGLPVRSDLTCCEIRR
jgi:hypothetical protein